MFCCFNSTQFQDFDFLQPTTATTSVATTSHTQLQTAHWTVAGQMLWHGVHTVFLVFPVCFPIFVGMSAGARKTALNTTRSWQQHFVGQATQTWPCRSLDAVLSLEKRCFRYWLQDAILSKVTLSSLHSCVSRMLKRFGGVFESLCIKLSCLDTFDLVAWLTAMQLTGAKHGQWCRAVVRQVEIIIINYHDSNRIACKIPCHHTVLQSIRFQGLQAAVGLGVSASLTVLRTPREDVDISADKTFGQVMKLRSTIHTIEFHGIHTRCTEKFHVLQLRSFQMTLIHWWRTFPSKWNAVVFWFHDLCIKPKMI